MALIYPNKFNIEYSSIWYALLSSKKFKPFQAPRCKDIDRNNQNIAIIWSTLVTLVTLNFMTFSKLFQTYKDITKITQT